MNRRQFLPLLCLPLAQAVAAGGRREFDASRDMFLRAAARHFGIAPKTLWIAPDDEREPIHMALRTGVLHAWSAWDREGLLRVRGFAARGVGIAFDGYTDAFGNVIGLKHLIVALRLRDADRPHDIDAIANRFAFCLDRHAVAERRFDEAIYPFTLPEGFDTEPRLYRDGALLRLEYLTMVPGLTGTFDLWRVHVAIDGNDRTSVTREPVQPWQ